MLVGRVASVSVECTVCAGVEGYSRIPTVKTCVLYAQHVRPDFDSISKYEL